MGFETRYIKCYDDYVVNVAYIHVASINCTVEIMLGHKYVPMHMLNKSSIIWYCIHIHKLDC